MATIGTEHAAPGVTVYRRLYYRWEREQWEAGKLDLAPDRAAWTESLSGDERTGLENILSLAYAVTEVSTEALVPFVDAAPTEEQQVFLTTQLVDKGRHLVLLDRYLDEVAGDEGPIGARSGPRAERLDPGARALVESVMDAARRVRATPGDAAALAEGVVLEHLVLTEAVLGTIRAALLRALTQDDRLPALRVGLTAMEDDGARHLDFGVALLSDLVRTDASLAETVRRTAAAAESHIRSVLHSARSSTWGLEATGMQTAAATKLAEHLDAIGAGGASK